MLQVVLLVLPHAILYEHVTSISVALLVVVANPDSRLKQVHIAEKRDAGLVYALELASSIRVLLLAFLLLARVANVLPVDQVLTDHHWMPA